MTEEDGQGGIITDRLLLRRFRREDLDAYARIMGDNEVGKWFPKGAGYTRKEAKRARFKSRIWCAHLVNASNSPLRLYARSPHADEKNPR